MVPTMKFVNSIIFSITKRVFFLLFHMCEGFAYAYIYTLHVCLRPANPSFRFLGTKVSDVVRYLELNPGPLHE